MSLPPPGTPASPTRDSSPAERLFCTFRLGGRLFGVDILHVKEVTAEANLTRVAHAPGEVLGLVNIRGHIYLALDLRRLLGMPAAPVTPETRLVLFKASVGYAFGVAVDQIADAADDGIGRLDLIDAVAQLPDELLVVLNPARFLAVVEDKLTPDHT